MKITITMRALTQRINRKLSSQMEILKVARGNKMRNQVGDYFIINEKTNKLTCNIKPEMLARSLKVIKEWETVSS